MTYTFDETIISDLHKDAYGFRPREGFWNMWAAFNDDQKQVEWDRLISVMDESMEQQRLEEENALREFRKTLRKVMDTMNCSWNRAVEVLAEAEGDDLSYDFDYFMWKQGLGFDDRQKIHKLYKAAS